MLMENCGLGYYYIILDDCWSDGRTPNGTLKANATAFPNGIPYIADQLHGMGLGFGMYSSAGKYTCAQYAASLGMEKQDAQTFADWGVGKPCIQRERGSVRWLVLIRMYRLLEVRQLLQRGPRRNCSDLIHSI